MVKTYQLLPGVTLRVFPDDRFKQNFLSIQLVTPTSAADAAYNALFPAVLLRGCESAPDMRHIILRQDDLYGASINSLLRRIGDYQATGLSCVIADTITPEADITGLVDYVSLTTPAQIWADLALEKAGKPRKNTHEDFIHHGYDIDSATNKFVELVFGDKVT